LWALSTGKPVIHRLVWSGLPSRPALPETSRLHCYHIYDSTTGLFALTATGADTRRWTAVLDRDELDEIADRAVDDTWSGGSQPLGLDELRAFVVEVTGRDPCTE
jgi:hypothetical protein